MPDPLQDDLAKTAAYLARQNAKASAKAAKLAHAVLDEIIAFIKPGIRESEVKNYAVTRYEHHAIEKPWHVPYVRFGPHTLLTYRHKAREDRVLGETDIAFADIGIVKDRVEGDAGRSVAFGNNPELQKLVVGSRAIFGETLSYWKQHNPDGVTLHAKMEDITRAHGFLFNLGTAGHLIGAYPHKGWKKGLNCFPQTAMPGGWVLEVQIRHPELPYGAFFEDLLY